MRFFRWFIKVLKGWNRYCTIILILTLDTILAEVQVLYFYTYLLWNLRDAYLELCFDSVKLSEEYGFQQFPSYNSIRVYFLVVGALTTRIFVNWVIFDGIVSGSSSHVLAGIVGSACTTSYIFIGGYVFWINQYVHFKLVWWFLALMLFGFFVYAVFTVGVLIVLWKELRAETLRIHSKLVGATFVSICGIFLVFLQIQVVVWLTTYVWNRPPTGNTRHLIFLVGKGMTMDADE